MASMSYAYYPGCSLESTALEFALSTKQLCEALDIELHEVDDWICCGASAAHIRSDLLGLSLPMINLAAAEKQNRNVMTCCSACHSRLKTAAHEFKENPELRAKINALTEEQYEAKTEVVNILEVLSRDVGPETIAAKVVRPLKGLKVACYYGCLLTKLSKELRTDSAENPMMMDALMTAIGAEPIDWSHKTECCGAALTLSGRPTVFRLVRELMLMAKENGADCIAVGCPLCQANLDMYQSDARAQYGDVPEMPIFYFTQLIGMALGKDPKDIGLAPVRSVIWNVLDCRDRFKDVSIVYGARSVQDLVYKRELTEWKEREDVNTLFTVDPGGETEDWDGKVGYVPTVLEESGVTSDNTYVVMCGPPIMIKFCLAALVKLGFTADQVYTTLENRMKCGVGKCGRCNVGSHYVCKDGPVFTAGAIDALPDDL